MKRVLVLGGGASGMVAAIEAAKAGAEVVLLEHNNKLGKKLLATGNGKCNLTNLVMNPGKYYSSEKEPIAEYLKQLDEKKTIEYFEKLGLLVKERRGYVYPNSEQAASVLECLSLTLKEYGVKVFLETSVLSVVKDEKSFLVTAEQHVSEENAGKKPKKSTSGKMIPRFFRGDVILCCLGGMAGGNLGGTFDGINIAKSFGHTVREPKPALVSMKLKETFLKVTAGVRQEAKCTLLVGNKTMEERGEVLFTDYGISGIPIMQLSRFVSCYLRDEQGEHEEPMTLTLDFFENKEESEIEKMVLAHTTASYAQVRSAAEAFTGLLPQKLVQVLLERNGIASEENASHIEKAKLMNFAQELKAMKLYILGTNGMDKAQVVTGGVLLEEMTENLESKRCDGLFLAGELLDVDGTCGGYNLQWAWTSGYIIGNACTKAGK